MEYNYNRILDEIRQLMNRLVLVLTGFTAVGAFFTAILCMTSVLPLQALWAIAGIIFTDIVIAFGVICFHKRAEAFVKKQQISMMAFHARKELDTLKQDFPDTLMNDCQLCMSYLTKNGIDTDNALKRLGGKPDTYNQLVLSFLGESDKLEDALFDLMHPETLLQYGYKAHTLRVMAGELGVTVLTDTAFFHEIEAFAGNIDVVRDNWKKLSFELDETYGIFFEYIKSLGLGNPHDNEEHQMTYKHWDERLQEAFNALETYDTIKAKKILSELIKYQIDSNITKTLQGMITNIDEIMAN